MKHLEEIEKLSLEELERIADDESISVPENIGRKACTGIMAEVCAGEQRKTIAGRRKLVFSFTGLAGAAAIAILAVMLFRPAEPQDTFDDPRLAYAEIEKTLSYISDKMKTGVDRVETASRVFDKPDRIIEKINRK